MVDLRDTYNDVVERDKQDERAFESVLADKGVRRLKRRREALKDDMDRAETEEEERAIFAALESIHAALRERIVAVNDDVRETEVLTE